MDFHRLLIRFASFPLPYTSNFRFNFFPFVPDYLFILERLSEVAAAAGDAFSLCVCLCAYFTHFFLEFDSEWCVLCDVSQVLSFS